MNPNSTEQYGKQVLAESDVWVTKYGGTRAAELASNADAIEDRRIEGKKQILAISAIRSSDEDHTHLTHPIVQERVQEKTGKDEKGFNTTSHLILIADLINSGDLDEARVVLERIRSFTKEIVNAQIKVDDKITDEDNAMTQLSTVIDQELDTAFAQITEDNSDRVISVGEDRLIAEDNGYYSITGLGENLARVIYVKYLQLRNQNATELKENDMSQEIFGDEPKEQSYDSLERDEMLDKVTSAMRSQISEVLDDNDVLVSGGYWSGVGSERGYTELTAALIAAACKQSGARIACLIEKDYPIMSADPRTIENTRIIERIKYKLALEIFGNQTSGADSQAIHAPALDVLAQNKVDIVVFNPDEPESGATLIQDFDEEGITGSEMIATRKISDALLIESSKMIVPGFLQEIGTWFNNRNISVVLPPSSQATMSLTFANGGPNADQVAEFEAFLKERYGDEHITLESIPGQTLVYCLGHDIKNSDARLRAELALHSIGVTPNMDMKGYQQRVMIYSVDNDDADKTAVAFHKFCIENKDTPVEHLLSA